MTSPYSSFPIEKWQEVTARLLKEHPLKPEQILEVVQNAWNRLWKTKVGDQSLGFSLQDIDPPATVVGYFFEKLFSKELAAKFPTIWIGGSGAQKDIHCLIDDSKSIEMKTSGQMGTKIFGNRSYGQKVENADAQKKDKSGYYITVNFFAQALTLVRFGWIDADDWQAQKSPTGQMAGLGDDIYRYKLMPIRGAYMLDGPIQLINGIGAKAASDLAAIGVKTIRELLEAKDTAIGARYQKFKKVAHEEFGDLFDS